MRPPPGRSSKTAGFTPAIWAISTGTATSSLKGRIKEIIVLASGKNISAEEVGQYYLQAPSIKEIFVTADARAEKLAAVVVPDLDFFRKTGEKDIYDKVKWDLELLSRGLEPYKRVRDFVLVNEELPKTRLGKVRIHEAQRLYQERAGKQYVAKKLAVAEGISTVGLTVVQVLARRLGDDRISLDDHLELDLGLDSLGSGGTALFPGTAVQPQDPGRRISRHLHGPGTYRLYRSEKSRRGPGPGRGVGGLGRPSQKRATTGLAAASRHERRIPGQDGHPGAGVGPEPVI